MSKDKRKKIARAIYFQALMTDRERAAKKVAKSERDAKAKRDKRMAARASREAGVVAAPIDDGTAIYVAAPHDSVDSWDAENSRYEHGRLPAAPREFVTWSKADVAQVLGHA